MQALAVNGLTKVYRNGVKALQGIDLTVEAGDFFALLGPNGAGKSTLIGIFTSLVNKTAGSVKIFDHDIDIDFSAAKSCIGVVPQEFNMNIFDTVQNTLDLSSRLLWVVSAASRSNLLNIICIN